MQHGCMERLDRKRGPEVPKLRSFVKIIGIEEHFLHPAVRASWATSASPGQDASEVLNSSNLS